MRKRENTFLGKKYFKNLCAGEVSPSLRPGALLFWLLCFCAPVLRYPLLGGRLDKTAARPCIVVAAPTKNCGSRIAKCGSIKSRCHCERSEAIPRKAEGWRKNSKLTE